MGRQSAAESSWPRRPLQWFSDGALSVHSAIAQVAQLSDNARGELATGIRTGNIQRPALPFFLLQLPRNHFTKCLHLIANPLFGISFESSSTSAANKSVNAPEFHSGFPPWRSVYRGWRVEASGGSNPDLLFVSSALSKVELPCSDLRALRSESENAEFVAPSAGAPVAWVRGVPGSPPMVPGSFRPQEIKSSANNDGSNIFLMGHFRAPGCLHPADGLLSFLPAKT